MSVLAVLVTAGLVLAGTFLAGFVWAARSGQFDDTTTPAVRILMDGDDLSSSARRETALMRQEEPTP